MLHHRATKKKIYNGDSAVKSKTSTKTKSLNFFQWFVQQLKSFCSVTALHGYNHIVKEDSALWERIGWAIVDVIALIAAIILLVVSWNWNAETPTVTVIESTHYATWNIPFPSVTICNANKISKQSALNLATTMKRPVNITAEDLSEKFRLLIYFESSRQGDINDYKELHDILTMNNRTVQQMIEKLAPTCSDMLERCMWKGTQARCDTLFQTVKTSQGNCCSFNNFGLEKSNYPTKVLHSIPKQPRRVTACGYQTGLSVLIKTFKEDYHTTVLSNYGFRVMLHNSYDFADDNSETKLINSNMEAFISIAPEATYSTSAVYNQPRDVRNCLSDDEVKMDVMQKYSYTNCLAECRSQIVYNLCGCIPYYLPNNGSVPYCNMDKLKCIKDHTDSFQGSLPGKNYTVTSVNDVFTYPCNCYPNCELLQYPSEISMSKLNRDYSFNSISFFKDVELTDQTLLHVFFNDLVSTHYRKDMYQNWLGVLASFGGLLGLFLGFSLINGFELFYFFTIRPLFDRFEKRKVEPVQ